MSQTPRDLFSPLTVGSLTIPNRFAMAPMTRAASPGGVPGTDVADYYARRAAGGVGLIITEGVRLADPAAGWPFSIPTLSGTEALDGWRTVTDAVHVQGAVIAAQLWHQGAERADGDGVVPVSPSGVNSVGVAKGRALRADELGGVAAQFAEAARNAKAVGFDAVELHSAHGYLLDEFLWEKTNQRTDSYGGSPAARTRFPAEVVAAVREAVGTGFPIIYRFSQWKANAYDAQLVETPAELEQVLAPLVAAGVDVLHPSTRRVYIPAFPGSDLSLAGWTKKITGVPVIGVGSVGLATEFQPGKRDGDPIEPAPVDRLLAQFTAEEFDIVAIGRALLADPGWVNRLRDDTLGGFTGYHAETALARLY
ncbi:12-oxophytodienoate reductase [Mycolicibacterium peregrinum]|uniref:NADH:flavin oxidoreductase n=1 Tax=Mycolicibacterium peregrinum TaxID=43304 RepID=UPI0007EA4A9F|nr:NADH:flavin oxidoreductase [Mycolicibacterium peregrinum]OBF41208.1 12-oxophytodienoate reductase [Mycolicibacterium peregrinum]